MKSKVLNIPIGGFLKQSLIDYPGNIACMVFTRGCNFRCAYCHNAELVWPERYSRHSLYQPDEILDWIDQNKLLLDAVVITGGEPTLHGDLRAFISAIKARGLKIKLDTNGTNPDSLGELLNNKLLDYVAMDIKAPLELERYKEVAGSQITDYTMERVKKSVEILCNSNIDYEFRTTADPSLSVEDFIQIAGCLKNKYFIQNLAASQDIPARTLSSGEVSKIKNAVSDQLELSLRG